MSRRKRCCPEEIAKKFVEKKFDPQWITQRFIDPFIGNSRVHLS